MIPNEGILERSILGYEHFTFLYLTEESHGNQAYVAEFNLIKSQTVSYAIISLAMVGYICMPKSFPPLKAGLTEILVHKTCNLRFPTTISTKTLINSAKLRAFLYFCRAAPRAMDKHTARQRSANSRELPAAFGRRWGPFLLQRVILRACSAICCKKCTGSFLADLRQPSRRLRGEK